MNKRELSAPETRWSLVWFAAALIIPSTTVIQKYLGIVGVVFYLVITSLILWLAVKYQSGIANLLSKITDNQLIWLIILTFLFLLIAFVIIYPIANSGIIGGGSDNDESLNLATAELIKGHYPYYAQTYLGMFPSVMPGSMVVAIPFVLLGNSAYQNLFWTLIFFICMIAYLKNRRAALFLLWMVIALSPIFLQQSLTGGDYLANSIFVLLFIMWLVAAVRQTGLSAWKKTLLAGLLGVGLASRANFILLMPLIFSSLVHSAGWKPAMKYFAITCLSLGLLVIPFYLYDPQSFYPLHTNDRLGQFRTILPILSGILAIMLSANRNNNSLPILLRNCAIVMAFPVLCIVVIQSIMAGYPNFDYTNYGLPCLFFGVVAFFPFLFWNF